MLKNDYECFESDINGNRYAQCLIPITEDQMSALEEATGYEIRRHNYEDVFNALCKLLEIVQNEIECGYRFFDKAIGKLPRSKMESIHGFWTDGEHIMCDSIDKAEIIADFLEALYDPYFNDGFITSEWDREEDERDGTIDDHTGCVAVYYGEL